MQLYNIQLEIDARLNSALEELMTYVPCVTLNSGQNYGITKSLKAKILIHGHEEQIRSSGNQYNDKISIDILGKFLVFLEIKIK